MARTAVFGGSFNPIHYGHLRTALELKQTLDLGVVHFVPCASPPHRAAPLTDGRLRLRMVEAAIRGEPEFVADDRELKRPGLSYTIDTLASFRAEQPGASLCLLLGMDAFLNLPQWHRWQDLFDVAHVSYLPTLVDRRELLAANSRLQAAEAVTEGAAFAAGGWLVQLLTAPLALLVDAASFVASALFLGRIRRVEDPPEPAPRDVVAEIAEGVRALRRSRLLLPLAAGAVLAAFSFQVVGVVYLLYVSRELGFAPGPLGLIFAVGAASSFELIRGRIHGEVDPNDPRNSCLQLGRASEAHRRTIDHRHGRRTCKRALAHPRRSGSRPAARANHRGARQVAQVGPRE